MIYSLEGKRGEEVMLAMIVALWPFIGKIQSITVDNGKEFSGHEAVSTALGVQVYFAPTHTLPGIGVSMKISMD